MTNQTNQQASERTICAHCLDGIDDGTETAMVEHTSRWAQVMHTDCAESYIGHALITWPNGETSGVR